MGIKNFNVLLAVNLLNGLSQKRFPRTRVAGTTTGLFVDTIALIHPVLVSTLTQSDSTLQESMYADVAMNVTAQLRFVVDTLTASYGLPSKCYLAFDCEAPEFKRYTQIQRRNKPNTIPVPSHVRRQAFEFVCVAVREMCRDVGMEYDDSSVYYFGEGEQIAIWAANRWLDEWLRRPNPGSRQCRAFVCGVDWDIVVGSLVTNFRLGERENNEARLEFLKLPCRGAGQIELMRVAWNAVDANNFLNAVFMAFATGSDYFPGVASGTEQQFKDIYRSLCAADRNTLVAGERFLRNVLNDDGGVNDAMERKEDFCVFMRHVVAGLVGFKSVASTPTAMSSQNDVERETRFEEATTYVLRLVWTLLYHLNTVYDESGAQFLSYDYQFPYTFDSQPEFSRLNNAEIFRSNDVTSVRAISGLMRTVLFTDERRLFDRVADIVFSGSATFVKVADSQCVLDASSDGIVKLLARPLSTSRTKWRTSLVNDVLHSQVVRILVDGTWNRRVRDVWYETGKYICFETFDDQDDTDDDSDVVGVSLTILCPTSERNVDATLQKIVGLGGTTVSTTITLANDVGAQDEKNFFLCAVIKGCTLDVLLSDGPLASTTKTFTIAGDVDRVYIVQQWKTNLRVFDVKLGNVVAGGINGRC